ncbi:MAG: sulfite exporter TauE/SafE family protein [Chlamydiia bacterium]|nr:sulfite exporter TauE/SafE family protein [Chlamydiia bacterium]
MTLFLSLLPIYVFGNLHCIGMCGPLVLFIGQHPYRYCYFLGRTLSFALAGLVAGMLGAVLNQVLHMYHLGALASFIFGALILTTGVTQLFRLPYPGYRWLSRRFGGMSRRMGALLNQEGVWPTFLFGLCTVLLPCGQTLIVYSACALEGDPLLGFLNGAAFALITSPSLWLAMHARTLLAGFRQHYNLAMALCALLVGVMALCRGFADLQMIPHLVLNERYHIVLY